MNEHQNSYSNHVHVTKQLHKNPNTDSICFNIEMSTNQNGLDICENCAESMKGEALKMLKKEKMS